MGFFPQQMEEGETVDMRRVWNLIEERKREDSLLRRELGWGSQSGVSASVQQSQPVVRQSPEGLGGMEDEQVVEKAGREEELIVLANVDTNGMIEGEKAVSEHEGVKEITNIAEQDEEDDDVGLPWF